MSVPLSASVVSGPCLVRRFSAGAGTLGPAGSLHGSEVTFLYLLFPSPILLVSLLLALLTPQLSGCLRVPRTVWGQGPRVATRPRLSASSVTAKQDGFGSLFPVRTTGARPHEVSSPPPPAPAGRSEPLAWREPPSLSPTSDGWRHSHPCPAGQCEDNSAGDTQRVMRSLCLKDQPLKKKYPSSEMVDAGFFLADQEIPC